MPQTGYFTGCGLLFRELEKALLKVGEAGKQLLVSFFLSSTTNKPDDFMQVISFPDLIP